MQPHKYPPTYATVTFRKIWRKSIFAQVEFEDTFMQSIQNCIQSNPNSDKLEPDSPGVFFCYIHLTVLSFPQGKIRRAYHKCSYVIPFLLF